MSRVKIVTACSVGLIRSVGLAEVLRLHYEPVDVIPLGVRSNSKETMSMLGQWCDWFVVMQDRYRKKVPPGFEEKLLVCEVGPDRYGDYGLKSHRPELIVKAMTWCHQNKEKLGIKRKGK
jgi:predicted protein tyrosine phosphatase